MLSPFCQTTVVGPLLALLLADGKRLVMEVVPKALLDFSRAVMRERFSAVIMKPVYTFSFGRATPASPALLAKLKRAAETRAVVVSSPTALKSFALRLVELSHAAGNAARKDLPTKQQRPAIGNFFTNLGGAVLSLVGADDGDGSASSRRRRAMRPVASAAAGARWWRSLVPRIIIWYLVRLVACSLCAFAWRAQRGAHACALARTPAPAPAP